jgi:hypothetical protein
MKSFLNKIITAILFLSVSSAYAQEAAASSVEMADGLCSNGKIYIVVAVMSIIFIGILIYLIRIDKKIGKVEEKLNQSIH